MYEWIQTLRESLPDLVLAVVAGLAVFLALEAVAMGLARAAYRRSAAYVRDQWCKSKHWNEYRALECQRLGHDNTSLPNLERLHELESLDRMVPRCLLPTAAAPGARGTRSDASQRGVCV